MKQKYRIWKKEKGKKLLIQEYAVLTAESRKQKLPGLQNEDFSLLCEQSYQADEVKKAAARGKDELILLLRSRHFFPIGTHMDLIAGTVANMFASSGEHCEDLVFDDKEILLGASPEAETEDISKIEEDVAEDDHSENIDELLEDDTQIEQNKAAAKIKPDLPDED